MTWLLMAMYFNSNQVSHVRDIATFSSVELCRSALLWTVLHEKARDDVRYECVPILGGERE